MARPRRDDGKTYLHLHKDKSYLYAVSRDPVTSLDGRRTYTMVVWGTLDDRLAFHPNSRFLYARTRWDDFVFPPEWDVSKVDELRNAQRPGRPAYGDNDVSRLYGSVWFLTEVARKTGLVDDLRKVFGGNTAMVDDVLTLAFYPILSRRCFNSLHVWQGIERMPTHDKVLRPSDVTMLTERITEQNRMDLFRCRMERVGKGEVVAVDSTSKSSYGTVLSDIRRGKNKEHLPLPQTNEVVAYGLKSHMPVFAMQLPGNIPDSRTLREIYTELRHAGFNRFTLLTDRGYTCESTLDILLGYGNPFVMAAKVSAKRIQVLIESVESGDLSMVVDERSGCYCVQVPLGYFIRTAEGNAREVKGLKANLYLDDVMRARQKRDLTLMLQRQETELKRMASALEAMDEDARRVFRFFDIVLDAAGRIASFSRDEQLISRKMKGCGYFASYSYKVSGTAEDMHALYKMRDEQEKYFSQMKGLVLDGRNRAWNELSHSGRRFVSFVSLSVISSVKGIWSDLGLEKTFPTVMQMIDEMKSIRCIEHTGKAKIITPFVGKQLLVCEAFGLEVPKGCSPDKAKNFDSSTGKKKRGRPPKHDPPNDAS